MKFVKHLTEKNVTFITNILVVLCVVFSTRAVRRSENLGEDGGQIVIQVLLKIWGVIGLSAL